MIGTTGTIRSPARLLWTYSGVSGRHLYGAATSAALSLLLIMLGAGTGVFGGFIRCWGLAQNLGITAIVLAGVTHKSSRQVWAVIWPDVCGSNGPAVRSTFRDTAHGFFSTGRGHAGNRDADRRFGQQRNWQRCSSECQCCFRGCHSDEQHRRQQMFSIKFGLLYRLPVSR